MSRHRLSMSRARAVKKSDGTVRSCQSRVGQPFATRTESRHVAAFLGRRVCVGRPLARHPRRTAADDLLCECRADYIAVMPIVDVSYGSQWFGSRAENRQERCDQLCDAIVEAAGTPSIGVYMS